MFGCTWAAHWLRRGYCGCAWASFCGRGCTLAACLQPNGCNYWLHSNTYWLHVCSQFGCIHAASSAAYMHPVGCTMQPLFWLLFLAFGCTWLRWSYRQLKMQPKSWLSAAGPAGRQRNMHSFSPSNALNAYCALLLIPGFDQIKFHPLIAPYRKVWNKSEPKYAAFWDPMPVFMAFLNTSYDHNVVAQLRLKLILLWRFLGLSLVFPYPTPLHLGRLRVPHRVYQCQLLKTLRRRTRT